MKKANLSKGKDAKPRVLSISYDSRLPVFLEYFLKQVKTHREEVFFYCIGKFLELPLVSGFTECPEMICQSIERSRCYLFERISGGRVRRNSFFRGVALVMVCTMLPIYVPSTHEVIAATESKGETNWKLVWSDEFNGEELDTTKWAYETGSGYNSEEQYYTEDNVSVSDGTLKITAKKESVNGYDYTSGRIETITEDGEALFSTKYGKIEARMKLPEGTGMWPAFWMQPVDEAYGDWPLSGEIDIMEARGRVLNEVNGTLHFGQSRPFNNSVGGSYTFSDNTDITEYHVYAVEWKENEIIWYVDDVEYYRTSNWYTMSDEGEVAEYPAPFNKEFYLILNLAVGGTYDNYKVPSDDELPATMEVDYVRVYHDEQGYDDTNIYMPEGTRDDAAMASTPVFENGNLIADIDFETINEDIVYSDKIDFTNHNWYLMSNDYYKGNATTSKSVINGNTFANIHIIDPGTQTYSLQLAQMVPMAYGYVYHVSFDAKCAEGEKTIRVKAYGEENYSSTCKAALTTEVQHFEFEFLMEHETDMDAGIFFMVGLYEGDVSIGNVKVTVVDTYNPADPVIEEESDTEVEVEIEIETEKETETEVETEVETEAETEKETETEVETEVETEAEEETEESTNGSTQRPSFGIKETLKYLANKFKKWW